MLNQLNQVQTVNTNHYFSILCICASLGTEMQAISWRLCNMCDIYISKHCLIFLDFSTNMIDSLFSPKPQQICFHNRWPSSLSQYSFTWAMSCVWAVCTWELRKQMQEDTVQVRCSISPTRFREVHYTSSDTHHP